MPTPPSSEVLLVMILGVPVKLLIGRYAYRADLLPLKRISEVGFALALGQKRTSADGPARSAPCY
jgi:hypothetical protein